MVARHGLVECHGTRLALEVVVCGVGLVWWWWWCWKIRELRPALYTRGQSRKPWAGVDSAVGQAQNWQHFMPCEAVGSWNLHLAPCSGHQ